MRQFICKNLVLVIPLLLLFGANDALAQSSLNSSGADIANAINSFFDALASKKGQLLADGRKLTMILAALMLTWYGLMSVLEGGQIHMVMGGLVRTFIVFGLVIGLLTDYSTGGVLDPVKFIAGSMTAIEEAVSTTGGASLGEGLYPFLRGIVTIGGSDLMPNNCGTGMSALACYLAGLFTFFPVIALKIIAIICLVLGAVFFAGYSMLGKIMIGIGVILGPVMLPWILLPPAQFLFSSWIRFMITGGMYMVVANIMAGAASGALQLLDGYIEQSTGAAELIFASALMMIISLLLAFLMMQISSIASGLISGSANADVSARMVGNVGGFAGGGGKAMSTVSGAVQGGVNGYKNARDSNGSKLKGIVGGSADGASRAWNHGRPGDRAQVKPPQNPQQK